jgi:hypothetical protein
MGKKRRRTHNMWTDRESRIEKATTTTTTTTTKASN